MRHDISTEIRIEHSNCLLAMIYEMRGIVTKN